MKVPLAVKVMLAFVAVIAAGAAPVQLSMRRNLQTAAQDQLANDLLQRASLVAAHLLPVPVPGAVQALQAVASVVPERVMLVRSDGAVLFDSAPRPGPFNVPEHPEVVQALQGTAASSVHITPLQDEHVDAAVPWLTASGQHGVVRVSASLGPMRAVANSSAELTETGVAVSVSLALLLSFAAVLRIVRPLQRMRDAATRLAQGELTVRADVNTGDELEELARAVEGVGAQLRARLAHAGDGQALLGQFVHAMVQGVVLMTRGGQVQHINGVARAQLGLRGPHESERVARLLGCSAVTKAMAEAVSDPLGVDMRVPHPVTNEPMDGTVVALRRLDGDTLFALVLDVLGNSPLGLANVPDPLDVVAIPLRELMDRVLARVQEDLEDSSASFKPPDEWPATQVADVGGAVESALVDVLKAAVRSPGAQLNTPLTASIQDGSVVVGVPVGVPAEFLKGLEHRMAPLGGRLESAPGRVQLWLPRA